MNSSSTSSAAARGKRAVKARAMNSSTNLCRQVWPQRCLDARTQPVARVPPAHPQFPSLVISHKPVVGLLLLRSADVARYRLTNHRTSPLSAQPICDLADSSPAMAGVRDETNITAQTGPAKHCCVGVYFYFIALPWKSVRVVQKESSIAAKMDTPVAIRLNRNPSHAFLEIYRENSWSRAWSKCIGKSSGQVRARTPARQPVWRPTPHFGQKQIMWARS